MMKKPIIVGAGLAGLIAANMLRDGYSQIIESQKSLPNNHSALLRFRSSVVGDATGIPFSKVKVMKVVHGSENPLSDAIRYSMKVTGKAVLRSITTASGEIEDRYIAPGNLVSRLGARVSETISYGQDIRSGFIDSNSPIISTIPMPALMKILGYESNVDFNSVDGWTLSCDLGSDYDFCGTAYFPGDEIMYRASVTGSTLIIEGVGDLPPRNHAIDASTPIVSKALGIPIPSRGDFLLRRQKYAKILPIPEDERKRFIMWASDEHGIYSLGRFATWRPGLLLDDLVKDVRIIQRIISGDLIHTYSSRK